MKEMAMHPIGIDRNPEHLKKHVYARREAGLLLFLHLQKLPNLFYCCQGVQTR